VRLHIAREMAMYSASVVLKATSDCSFDAHKSWQLANKMTYPVRDLTEAGS